MKQLLLNSNQNNEEGEEENKFPNLTPRRGSLPVDYNRPSPRSPRFSPKFPLTSPTTPQNTSPTRLSFNTFSPITEDYDEINDTLSELMNRGRRKSSDSLLNKLLDQKENDLKRLESQNQQLLSEKSNWEKTSLKVNQLEKTILKLNKKLEEQKTELEQTGDDVYQLGEKNDELTSLLSTERLNNRKLEKRLEQQVNENDWLRSSFNQTKSELLEKVNELNNLKRIEKQDKEEWRKIFTEQEEKYELEKKEREKVFNKQINNLRTFQLTADIPLNLGRGRGLHKKSFSLSLPGSRSVSPYPPTPPKDLNLFSELEKTSYFNSPLSKDNDPFEEINNQFTDLLNEVDNVANDNDGENELLTENETLKVEKLALERNYKTLFDEKVEQERLLKNFNEKELAWEKEKKEFEKLLFNLTQKEQGWTIEKQSLQEQLNEKDYQLAETKSQKNQVEKRNKELIKISQEHEEYFASLEVETDELDNAIQENKDLFAQLEAKMEINLITIKNHGSK